jgi:glutamine cyclotransferase
MSSLWPSEDRKKHGADVLNGISISKEDGILYITGKNWDRMFRVKLEGFFQV